MAIDFNGSTSRIDYGSASDLNDLAVGGALSVSAWIKADTNGESGTGRILNKRNSEGGGGWMFFQDTDATLGFISVRSVGISASSVRGATQ